MERARAAGSRDRRWSVALATVWAILLLFVASAVLRPWPDSLYAIDFIAFWTGGTLIQQGASVDLVDTDRQGEFQVQLRRDQVTDPRLRAVSSFNPYHNPPALALLFAPFSNLPIVAGYLLWTAFSLACFLVALALPLRGKPLARTLTVGMLSFGAVGDSLLTGQLGGLLVAVFSLGLLALSSRRPFLGGALIGLLWLKPQYAALFALVFLVKRRWRELAGMAATTWLIGVVSVALVGVDGMVHYLELLRRISAFYPPPQELVHPQAMINWRSLLVNAMPGIPELAGWGLVVALGAVTSLLSLLVWRGPWQPSSPRFAYQMLVTAIAVVLSAPHSHFHGLTLVLAPLAMTKTDGVLSRRSWYLVLAVGYLLGLVVWPVESLRWLMALYLVPILGLLTRAVLRAGSEVPEAEGGLIAPGAQGL